MPNACWRAASRKWSALTKPARSRSFSWRLALEIFDGGTQRRDSDLLDRSSLNGQLPSFDSWPSDWLREYQVSRTGVFKPKSGFRRTVPRRLGGGSQIHPPQPPSSGTAALDRRSAAPRHNPYLVAATLGRSDPTPLPTAMKAKLWSFNLTNRVVGYPRACYVLLQRTVEIEAP